MDNFNLNIVGCRKKDYRYSCEINEDVVLSLPNFSTIERFLTVGGHKANGIYDNMMSIAFPKSNDPPLYNERAKEQSNNESTCYSFNLWFQWFVWNP